MARIIIVLTALSFCAMAASAEERPAPKPSQREPAPDPRPNPRPKYDPLPAALVGFSGHLTGTLVSVDEHGLTMKVSAPVAAAGRELRLLFNAFGNKEGGYTPDQDLVKAARKLALGDTLTVRAKAERDEALILDRIWAGAVDPAKGDPPPKPPAAPDR